MVKNTSLSGPKISSTFPTWLLFSRYIGALKYGILTFTDRQTISPSHDCMNVPISNTVSGGPCWSCSGPVRPPRPPLIPPLPLFMVIGGGEKKSDEVENWVQGPGAWRGFQVECGPTLPIARRQT